ncbi:helicase-related protein [Deferrisoma palaeochoriense]
MIRTEKCHAVDEEGKPLFRPRRTELVTVEWTDRYADQRDLYGAVTEYVREGYNRALREKRNDLGFLMILMQRLVASSTRAIRLTLERRLEVLQDRGGPQLTLFSGLNEEDWLEMDAEELVGALVGVEDAAVLDERRQVEVLLDKARRCEGHQADVKADALMEWLYRLQAEEGDPDLKVLVFTEFVSTQEMLAEFLSERGFEVVCLNGAMGLEERRRVQEVFADRARILISTDAGGEGLNLQFCHVVIN